METGFAQQLCEVARPSAFIPKWWNGKDGPGRADSLSVPSTAFLPSAAQLPPLSLLLRPGGHVIWTGKIWCKCVCVWRVVALWSLGCRGFSVSPWGGGTTCLSLWQSQKVVLASECWTWPHASAMGQAFEIPSPSAARVTFQTHVKVCCCLASPLILWLKLLPYLRPDRQIQVTAGALCLCLISHFLVDFFLETMFYESPLK